jgi:hypothetical protein
VYLGDILGGASVDSVMQTHRVRTKVGEESQLREAHLIQEQVFARALGASLVELKTSASADDASAGSMVGLDSIVVPPGLDALFTWQPACGALSPHCRLMFETIATILEHKNDTGASVAYGSPLYTALTFFLAPVATAPQGATLDRASSIKNKFRKSYHCPIAAKSAWVHSAQRTARTVET